MKICSHYCLLLIAMNVFSLIGMKRIGNDLVHCSKRKKMETIDLFNVVKECDFNQFEKGIREGADVNQKHNKEPLFFYILNTIDQLRIENLHSMVSIQNTELREYVVEKNNDATQELYRCLELLLHNEKFNSHCLNAQNQSIIEVLIWRNQKKRYNAWAERKLKSLDDSFVMQTLLKKEVFVGPYADDKIPLHYVALEEKGTERNLKTMELLAQYFDINKMTAEGNTPLHICSNNFKMVLLLLSLDAQFNPLNNNNEMPVDISENYFVFDLLTNEIKVEKYKKAIREIVLKNTLQDNHIPHILNFTLQREVVPHHFIDNLYPYTQAVIEYIENSVPENMQQAVTELEEESLSDYSDNEYNAEE